MLSRKASRHNLAILRRQVRASTQLHRADAKIMAIVKADAYGHHLSCVLPELERQGVKEFAVASLAEGVEARRLSSKAEILVLGGTFDWKPAMIRVLRENRLKVAANDLPSLKKMMSVDGLKVHLKLDTGMNRLGISPHEWGEAIQILKASRNKLDGLMTHYASAGDSIFVNQVRLFDEGLIWFWSNGVRPPIVHSENSAALFCRKPHLRETFASQVANRVRPGIALHGYLTKGVKNTFGLRPVLELVSELGIIKRVEPGDGISYGHLYRASRSHDYAVVPLGYADGLSKSYAQVLSPEWRSPSGHKKGQLLICGAICMDMVMVRAKRGKLKTKDRIVFWGRFPNSILHAGLVEPYELNLRIAKRIPRVWVNE
jgi:alanine racemase